MLISGYIISLAVHGLIICALVKTFCNEPTKKWNIVDFNKYMEVENE